MRKVHSSLENAGGWEGGGGGRNGDSVGIRLFHGTEKRKKKREVV